MKWLKSLGLAALASLAFSTKAKACSDAKPAGRAYANIAVADGASAVYYNPAGLIQLEKPELNLTIGSGRYKGFMCYAQPIDDKSAVGINFAYRKDKQFFSDEKDLNTLWFKIGYSRKLNKKISIGASIDFTRDYYDSEIITYSIDGKTIKTFLNPNLGILYKPNKKLSLGLLLQGYGPVHNLNVRPGMSLKLNKDLFLALDGYDVTNVGDSRSVNLGLEKRINNNWSIRGGLMIGNPKGVEVLGIKTTGNLGFSYRKGDLETSLALAEQAPFLILGVTKRF